MDTTLDNASTPEVVANNKTRTSITISPELLEKARVKAKSRESNRSVSAVIESALTQYLG